MKEQKNTYVKNILMPCFLLSAVTGVLAGALIFLFKLVSSRVIAFSERVYAAVRAEPRYLLPAALAAAAIGFAVTLLLKYARDCRGGGIPTAVASSRGLISIKWQQSIFGLFASSLMTYLCGVPLGNEGPSVQMGVAMGKGTTDVLARKNKAWERYIMTGGACAGFAAATGAPLSGIIFAMEEVHRRFSPTIFMAAAVSVITGTVTEELLCSAAGMSTDMFSFKISATLPARYLWVTVVIGAACGLLATVFTLLYRAVRAFSARFRGRAVGFIKIPLVFFAVVLFGFLSEDFIGSGHSLTEKLLAGDGVWYILLAALAVRALLMISANNEGVSGGVFLPVLTFGAIIGALIARAFIAAGIIDELCYPIFVVVGMAAFLAAASRTPITALTFSAEALCGIANLLPLAVGVAVSYIIIETVGIPSFNDTIMEAKVELENRGKTPAIVSAHLRVAAGSFAVGKEVRDILWPPTCAVLSVDKNNAQHAPNWQGLSEGDVLHLHYQTYDAEATMRVLEDILGAQGADPCEKIHEVTRTHSAAEN